MASAHLLATIVVLAVAAVANADEPEMSPTTKVLELLNDMKAKSEAEGEAEATTYGKFACFCKTTSASKSESITELQDSIDTLSADIGSKAALRAEKMDKEQVEKQKKEATTTKLQKATAIFQKDKTTFEAKDADLSKALGSTTRSLRLMSSDQASASFLSVGSTSDLRIALSLADALGLVYPSKAKAVGTLLQRRVDPTDPEYKLHSHEIVSIITKLGEDFSKERDDAREEWRKARAAFNGERSSMEQSIETSDGELETLSMDVASLKGDIASKRIELITAEASLKDDSAYLKELTGRCQQKGHDWDQRTKMRESEVNSIDKAVELLDTVTRTEEVNTRRLALMQKRPAVPARAKAVLARVQNNAKAALAQTKSKAEAKSLLQTTTSLTREVQDLLHHEAERLHSTALASLASKIQADPFGRVKELVQGLTERLLAESKSEATKAGFCQTELAKSMATRDSRLAEISKVDAQVSSLDARKDVLAGDITMNNEDLESLRESLEEAQGQRVEDKAETAETLKDARDGVKATVDALALLSNFFKSASKASLAQTSASPIDEDTEGAGFKGNYKGQQDSSRAVLGLLQTIQSDYENTIKSTEAAEARDAAESVKFEEAMKTNIAGKEKSVALCQEDLRTTRDALQTGIRNIQTAQNLLDGALENIEQLKPTCIDTGMSYTDRMQKRDSEIQALQQADNMLKNAE